ncbi:MAG: hypothetical protein J5J00_07130 [Deltaproteobacteria bacterium]|nr:hypothetical protein [Deltaproteobacteria bacterium]
MCPPQLLLLLIVLLPLSLVARSSKAAEWSASYPALKWVNWSFRAVILATLALLIGGLAFGSTASCSLAFQVLNVPLRLVGIQFIVE